MFNRSVLVAGIAAALGFAQLAFSQDGEETERPPTPDLVGTRYAIDHIFFFSDGFAPELPYTEQRGFRSWPFSNTHTGQGTTGRYLRFDNVYLEYLWMDDAAAAEANIPAANSDFNARNRWREDASISPFGIGLRDLQEGEPHAFGTTTYTAEWMRGNFELYPAENAPDITEPWVFFLPLEITANARDTFEGRAAETLDHDNGARLVTAMTVILPHGQEPSHTLRVLEADGVIDIAHGDAHLIELTLDNGVQGRSIDMRDRGMPIIFHL